jgi:histidyl-tRNA synthetase
MIAAAPKLAEHLDEESSRHFTQLRELLDDNGISYRINPCLVRGLDYYNRTVFEWVTDQLGAQGTVCAGGRYDGLVQQLGGRATPAVGFAMGIERLIELLDGEFVEMTANRPHGFLILLTSQAEREGRKLAEQLRDSVHNLRLIVNHGGGGLKNQIKRADKSQARFALIIGEDELRDARVTVKDLRNPGNEQQMIAFTDLAKWLSAHIS